MWQATLESYDGFKAEAGEIFVIAPTLINMAAQIGIYSKSEEYRLPPVGRILESTLESD